MKHLQLINASPRICPGWSTTPVHWSVFWTVVANSVLSWPTIWWNKHTTCSQGSLPSSEIFLDLLKDNRGCFRAWEHKRGQTRQPETQRYPNILFFLFKPISLDSFSPCSHTNVICIDFVISLNRCHHVRFVFTAKATLCAEQAHRAWCAGLLQRLTSCTPNSYFESPTYAYF